MKITGQQKWKKYETKLSEMHLFSSPTTKESIRIAEKSTKYTLNCMNHHESISFCNCFCSQFLKAHL